jgi:hypothetical protein
MSVYIIYQLPDGGASITRSVSEDESAIQVIGAIEATSTGFLEIVRCLEARLVGLQGASIEDIRQQMADTLRPHEVQLKLITRPVE